MSGGSDPVWVFAYGSLMWQPEFAHVAALPGTLQGYRRSLCLLSVEHRGTRERPGLVLGLDAGGTCEGVVYGIDPAERNAVIAKLDARELITGVYTRKALPVATERGEIAAWAYVVKRDHPQYLGDRPDEELLRYVRQGFGERGPCRDYVLNTAAHLREAGIDEPQLARLARALADEAAA